MEIRFPAGFLWGAATSAYQIEGAHEADGKAPSIWDRFTAKTGRIRDGTDGRVACDHYHRFGEDLALMRRLGLGAYRFSIAWPRVMSTPGGKPNRRGLDFYERLVDGLLERGIAPFPTLFHWDLPLHEQQRGGWESKDTAKRFADYVEAVAHRMGDRIRRWVTVNEPLTVAVAGYLVGEHAPGRRSLRRAFRAAHNLLLAHGQAVQRLRAFAPDAEVGPALNMFPVVPATERDRRLAERIDTLVNRLFLGPIREGAYPPLAGGLMRLLNRGFRREDLKTISEPVDFIGVNHYARIVIRRGRLPWLGYREVRNLDEDAELTAMDWEIFPKSFYDTLTWLRDAFGNPPVYITENGAAFNDQPRADGRVQDEARIAYLKGYLSMLRMAMAEGSDVRGYFVWSLLDNFEWAHGLSQRFGLVYVDYATLERTMKASGHWFGGVSRRGGFSLDEGFLDAMRDRAARDPYAALRAAGSAG